MADTLRGGGSIGPSRYMGYHCSWPLASLTVEPDSLTYRIFPLTYRFKKRDIQCLVEDRFLVFKRLRIVHRRAGFPKWFIFTPRDFSGLQRMLERHGHSVRPQEDGAAVPDPAIAYSDTITVVSMVGAILGILGAIVGILAAFHAR